MIIFHILSLCFVAYTLFLSEREAFAWYAGKKEMLDGAKLEKYHRCMWAGLVLLVITGLFLFWPARDYLPSVPAFRLKMFFVACLFMNGFALGKLMLIAARRTYKSLTKKEKMPIFISAGVSLTCWLGAFISAFFLLD